MKEESISIAERLLPLGVFAAGLALWTVLAALRVWHESAFPSPVAVANGFVEELSSGYMTKNLVVSLYRVAIGFALAIVLSVPLGLWMGMQARVRTALLPAVNFFRNLSPIAWIPFSILWFGVGDAPAIFLIFMAAFFPTTLSVAAAVANIPSVYFQVARDYGFRGIELLTNVTLPAIMPQFITTLRVTAGVAWLVLVAAEMSDGREGLGFMITDARNGLRPDLVVVGMIVIGFIGVVMDRVLIQLTRLPGVRWGYER